MARERKKKNNVTKFNRFATFNIGLIVFLVILIYTMYFVVQYITQEHVSVYEVETGSIVRDSVYTGIAIREETVVTADNAQEAVISLYASAGEKAGINTLIYSLSGQEGVSDLASSESEEASDLSAEDLASLFTQFTGFTGTYSDVNFYDLYSFETVINNLLIENRNSAALAYLQAENLSSGVSLYYAQSPGVVAYYTDGYESLEADEVTAQIIQSQSAERTGVSDGDTVIAGDAVYKLTNNENWQVVICVSESIAQELEEDNTVEVIFEKDGNSAWATVTVRQDGEDYLAVLSFTNSMARYTEDRFLTVTLDLDDVTGLKIPNSAITTKEFFLISKSFVTYDESEDSYALTIRDEDGGTKTIYPEIYSETDEDYYIIDDDLSAGTVIVDADGNTDTVFETGGLKGCYNINKGYAVFKQIEILYESESYTIIADDTDYGLAQFDYIALNASSVSEGQIVY